MESHDGRSGNMPNAMSIAREEAYFRGYTAGEKERARLREALKRALPGLVWMIEGPYGPSPTAEDLQFVRNVLAETDPEPRTRMATITHGQENS